MKKLILQFSFPIFCCLILLLMETCLINAQDETCDDDDGGSQASKFGEACNECYTGTFTSYVYISTSEGIQVRTPKGNLIQTLTAVYGNELTGMAVDTGGRILVSDLFSNTVSAFDKSGNLTGTFGSGYNLPGAIVIDNMSNVFVSDFNGNEIRKFDYNGNYISSFFNKEKINRMVLQTDNCALLYTSDKGDLLSYNLCTNAPQAASFTPGIIKNGNAFKILPDGSILIANGEDIIRLSKDGKLIQSYDVPGHDHWFALDLDPAGETFCCADNCNSNVWRFEIISGKEISYFNTGTGPGTVYEVVISHENASEPKVAATKAILNLKVSFEGISTEDESVLVSLRKTTSPYQIIDFKKGILDAAGYCSQLTFSNIVIGESYYIVINHKNSIESWSDQGIAFTDPIMNYEFTNIINSGDINQDGIVDATDLIIIYNTRGNSENSDTETREKVKDNLMEFENAVYNNAINFVTSNRPEGAQLSPLIDEQVNLVRKQIGINITEPCDENENIGLDKNSESVK